MTKKYLRNLVIIFVLMVIYKFIVVGGYAITHGSSYEYITYLRDSIGITAIFAIVLGLGELLPTNIKRN